MRNMLALILVAAAIVIGSILGSCMVSADKKTE